MKALIDWLLSLFRPRPAALPPADPPPPPPRPVTWISPRPRNSDPSPGSVLPRSALPS